MTQEKVSSDFLVRISHIRLWILLSTIVYVGCAMLVSLLGGPELAERARWALILLPVFNGIAFGAVQSRAGKAKCASSPEMRAVINDELRQIALSKGYRNGFFAALVTTVAASLAVSLAGVGRAPAVIMVAVVTVGVSTMLASVLYHDR
jgi:hypothetical protein